MKRYEITISVRDKDDGFRVESFDKVESDNIIELLTSFQLMFFQLIERMKEAEIIELKRGDKDDIPF